MLQTSKTVDGIKISYFEIDEFELNIPEGMTKVELKLWRETNLKDLKETKLELKAAMQQRIAESQL